MALMRDGDWTEAAILSLPPGENDNFELKSGRLLDDPDLRRDLAKELSAFANSGGGHLFIGVANDRTLDGVSRRHPAAGGRQIDTREWVEQLIPPLLDYPLQGFSVNHFVPDPVAPMLAPDRTVLVVNVPDSPLAPHQSAQDRGRYYCRQSGHSNPAPHNFVDLLRNRIHTAALTTDLVGSTTGGLGVQRATDHEFHGSITLNFDIRNTSRTVAASRWGLCIEGVRSISGTPVIGIRDPAGQYASFDDEGHASAPRCEAARHLVARVFHAVHSGPGSSSRRAEAHLFRRCDS